MTPALFRILGVGALVLGAFSIIPMVSDRANAQAPGFFPGAFRNKVGGFARTAAVGNLRPLPNLGMQGGQMGQQGGQMGQQGGQMGMQGGMMGMQGGMMGMQGGMMGMQ
ncbi:MAG: hypothetical protein LC104_11155, partial [Bacteroidales bacterium]|nr:hypothetical protein [Bacteroidales bacterium]